MERKKKFLFQLVRKKIKQVLGNKGAEEEFIKVEKGIIAIVLDFYNFRHREIKFSKRQN